MISLFGFNPKASWSVCSVTDRTVPPWCADLLSAMYKGPHWLRCVQKLMKSQHCFFGSQSSSLLFLGLLGIKQQEAGLRPTYLLSVTLLILVAMQFSLLSIFNLAELVMYEEQLLLWRTVCWRQSKNGCLKTTVKQCFFFSSKWSERSFSYYSGMYIMYVWMFNYVSPSYTLG